MKRLIAIPMSIACALLFAGLAVTAGCKQGEGERCQIDDDCEADLVCNQATPECARVGQSGGIDALPPIDGPPIDAPPDAPPDAN